MESLLAFVIVIRVTGALGGVVVFRHVNADYGLFVLTATQRGGNLCLRLLLLLLLLLVIIIIIIILRLGLAFGCLVFL